MPNIESQTGLQVVSFENGPNVIDSADWWVTSLCNLACDFCYGPEPGRDPAYLREQIALSLAASPAKTITFCGGEPLVLGKEIFEYARLFKAAGKRVVLNTNGELLERAIEKHLRPGEELPFDVIGISIEGHNQATHGEMRQRRDGKPASFAATFSGILAVKEYDQTSLKTASVVSGVSVGWLPQLVEFLRYEAEPDVIRFYQYNPNGSYNRGQIRHAISLNEFNRAVRAAELHADWSQIYASDNESQNCLIVDPNGGVSVSNKTGYTLLGNCLNEQIGELWDRQPESICGGVQRNKRWIGAAALDETNHHLQTDADSATDFQRLDARLLRDPRQELRTFLDSMVRSRIGYETLRGVCLGSVTDALSPSEAQQRWASLYGDTAMYANYTGELTGQELDAARKTADRLWYYARKAGMLHEQQDMTLAA